MQVEGSYIRNLFTSRTSALRRSEESCRTKPNRIETEHMGVWTWQETNSNYFQSVLPAAAFATQQQNLGNRSKNPMRCFDFIYEPNRIQTYRKTDWNVGAGPVMIGPDNQDLRIQSYSRHLECVVLRSLTDEECAQLPCEVVVVQLQTKVRRDVSRSAKTLNNSEQSPVVQPVTTQEEIRQKRNWFTSLLAWLRG